MRSCTPEYLAPEMLAESKSHVHGLAVDWWACGALLFELLDGKPPWYAKDRNKLFERIVRTPFKLPKKIKLSTDGEGLLHALLEKDPRKRLGSGPGRASDVKEHRFFAMVDFAALMAKQIEPPFKPTFSAFTDDALDKTMSWKNIDTPEPPRPIDIAQDRFDEIFKNWDSFRPAAAAAAAVARVFSSVAAQPRRGRRGRGRRQGAVAGRAGPRLDRPRVHGLGRAAVLRALETRRARTAVPVARRRLGRARWLGAHRPPRVARRPALRGHVLSAG
mmetsp:Transcript_27942/g.85744  ORF Transcript_27942/g.85744 Transcript_27942/m.85744 type:complete len:275 (-) Transcript_27942:985-1809(-)